MRTLPSTGAIRAMLAALWAVVALAAPGRWVIPVAATAAVVLATPVAAATAPPTRYVALGDSLAWGDGASIPTETGYVALLADYFAGVPHGGARELTNLAVRGETTASFLVGQLTPALAAIADPATDTRVVTLSLGGNDIGALLNDPGDACVQNAATLECQAAVADAIQGFASRFPVVLGALTAALASDDGLEQVYVMTLYNPFGGLGEPYESAVDIALLGGDLRIDCGALATDPLAIGMNDLIACTAMAFGAIVVDAHPVIGDDAAMLTHIGEGTLDTHPNDLGYELLAKAHRLAAP